MKDEDKTNRQLIAELTELRQRIAETEFKKVDEAYHVLVEHSLQGLVIVQDFHIVFANTPFAEISGYTVEELLSLSPEQVKAMIHPEDQALVWGRFQKRLKGKPVPPRYEYRGVQKNGTVRWLEMFASRIDYQGRPAIQGVILDITDRKRAEEELRKSEEKYRQLIENAQEGVWVIDKDAYTTFVNARMAEMLGYTVAEMQGRHLFSFMEQSRIDICKAYLERRKQGIKEQHDFGFLRKDGTLIYTSIATTPITNNEGDYIGALAFVADITDRKRAEQILKESEEKYRSLVESSEDAIYVVDNECHYLFANSKYLSRLGVQIDQFVGKAYREFHTPEGAKDFEKKVKSVFKTGQSLSYEHRSQRDNRYFIRTLSPVKDPDTGKPTAVTVISKDITDRKQAEEALQESEERFRKFADEASFEGIIIHDGEKILDVNQIFATMYGYERDELIGMDLLGTIAPEYCELVSKYIREEYEEPYGSMGLKKGGSTFPVEVHAKHIPFHGRMARGVAVRDITDRKRAEEELRTEALIYEHIYDGIIVTDLEGNIIRWNPAAERMFGYLQDEVVRKTVGLLSTRIIKGTLRDGRWSGEINFARKDGTEGVCETVVVPLRDEHDNISAVFGVCRDITERKQAEEELKASFEKLRRALEETVGALASAVEMRDPYTAGHQRCVAQLAGAIARDMGLPEDKIDGIRMAGLIHDLGKINVPAEILTKPGQIGELEFSIIKTHAQTGYEILKEIEFPWPVAQIVLQHHERLDESGYPLGLSGEDIFLEARILAVADVVEAMASHRPYRSALNLKKALEEISKHRGVLYDPDVVDACLRLFNEKGFTFE